MQRPFVFIVMIFTAMLVACGGSPNKNPVVKIETKLGSFEVELYPAKAPKTVAAFLSNIQAGIYKKAAFYRVLNEDNQPSDSYKSSLIQGGIWKTDYQLSTTVARIPHETTAQTGISHKDGVISMARLAPGTAGSEFFICIDDQPGFDYGGANNADGQGYAAFGKVIKGKDVVRKIYRQNENDQAFDPPIYIYSMKRL